VLQRCEHFRRRQDPAEQRRQNALRADQHEVSELRSKASWRRQFPQVASSAARDLAVGKSSMAKFFFLCGCGNNGYGVRNGLGGASFMVTMLVMMMTVHPPGRIAKTILLNVK
jgi:hypothetical protein